jgi:hypothetical protein
VRQRIIDVIAARPDGITRAELLDVVYGDDIDGGPDNANTISVLIKHANEDLKPQGFRIEPTWRGRGARYRLIRIEPQVAAMTMIDGILCGFHDAQSRILEKEHRDARAWPRLRDSRRRRSTPRRRA